MISRNHIECLSMEKCRETFSDELESKTLKRTGTGEYVPGLPRFFRDWRTFTDRSEPGREVIRTSLELNPVYDILTESLRGESL